MTELERVEHEIATLEESVRSSLHALEDPDLSAEGARRQRASIELYRRHLSDLLMRRDDLQALISKWDGVFEDGSRASNRLVPMEILGDLDGDQPARELIEQQEAEIAEKAGRPLREIQSLTRTAEPEPKPFRE